MPRAGAPLLLGLLLLAGCPREPDPMPAQGAALARAPSTDAGPVRRELANGLTLIVAVDHAQPLVAVESFAPAGLMQEPRDRAHVSHLAEHARSRGTTRGFEPPEMDALVGAGAVLNAETLASFVHYDYVVPPSELDAVLRLEAARLTGLRITDALLAQEAPRCQQEIDFLRASPQGAMIKFGLAALNQVIRYGVGHVAVRDGTARLTADDVSSFVAARYRASDVIVTVVGDVDPASVAELAARHLGSLPPGHAPELPAPTIASDVDATWDLGARGVYLVSPVVATDAVDRLALVMFGNWLNQSLNIDPALHGCCRALFATNQIYPPDGVPFFVYAERQPGAPPEPDLEDRLRQAVGNARESFLAAGILQTRFALQSFFSTSLVGQAPPPGLPHDMVLAQEAINLGVKEMLARGLPEGGAPAALEGLNAERCRAILDHHVGAENLHAVRFENP